ncbi:MAG: DNA topoisomerase IV subunit A [Planctomycetes bacterium]|nr:DNA topoisomerase IV subunit A [Planctomycetota bacterium]
MVAKAKKTKRDLPEALAKLADEVIAAANKGRTPSLDIPVRSLANVRFNEQKRYIEMGNDKQEREFFNVNMAKKFMQTMCVAAACRQLEDEGKTTSIRDLFYMIKHRIDGSSENTVDDQSESDAVIEDLEVTAQFIREELNLFAENKGALAGEITLVDSGDTIDGRAVGSGGWAIPSIVEQDVIQFKKCSAQFVLLIEKGAVWHRLNQDKFWRKHKCIILHGGGQPPRGVRRLCYRFVNELKLPLYVYVDNDPWGYYIYSVLKQGSINLAFESQRMAVPSARFIGLSSFDPEKYGLDKKATAIGLEEGDIRRAKEILAYPWFQSKEWQKEIHNMLANGAKFELEALTNKSISFVTEEYLPRKIKEKDWLD